ncbi:hypothetical protein ACQJBY_067757 [Aegilops geniculata]
MHEREHMTRSPLAVVHSSSTASRTRAQATVRRLPLSSCRLMDASEGLWHHRPLHLCCPTDVSTGRHGRLPLSSADPWMQAQAAAVATLRASPPSQRTLIRKGCD